VGLNGGDSTGCVWGDYDNDGYLDLFVCNLYLKNFLYHNRGDGTFEQITTGSLVNDGGPGVPSVGCSWGDYDNDGFLDLVVANGGGPSPVEFNNFLYRNNGNSNAWIKIKCVGTVSNRSAIGTKVRIKATIGGKTFWQMREVSCGDGFASGNPLETHFGLGDATNIDIVRIEWPSGIVQTLTNVAAKQFLTVEEHQPGFVVSPPNFTGVSRATNGVVNLSVTGDTGLLYVFEASTNLINWTKVGVRSNATGVVAFADTKATNYASRFYRVSIP
jgi:hypothetical protein